MVIFPTGKSLYQPDTPNKGVIEMIVRKNRHGGLAPPTACGWRLTRLALTTSREDSPAIVQAPSTARARFQEGSPF